VPTTTEPVLSSSKPSKPYVSEDEKDDANFEEPPGEEDLDVGFKIGKGKKLNVKMDMTKA
jgi:hypothetical protein